MLGAEMQLAQQGVLDQLNKLPMQKIEQAQQHDLMLAYLNKIIRQ